VAIQGEKWAEPCRGAGKGTIKPAGRRPKANLYAASKAEPEQAGVCLRAQAWPWKAAAPGPAIQPCWRSGMARWFRIHQGSLLLGLTKGLGWPTGCARMAALNIARGLGWTCAQTFCRQAGAQPDRGLAMPLPLRRLMTYSFTLEQARHQSAKRPVTPEQCNRFKEAEESCWLRSFLAARLVQTRLNGVTNGYAVQQTRPGRSVGFCVLWPPGSAFGLRSTAPSTSGRRGW